MTRTIEAAAILFDNDGVLVDSHADGERAWVQLCQEFGLDFTTISQEYVGCRPEDTLSRHVEPNQLAEVVERLEDLEVASASSTKLLAGAGQLLTALSNGRWAIATSAGQRLATARWAGVGLTPVVTVTAEDVQSGKPNPEPYVLAAQRLAVDPAGCVVFEDSPSGGVAGHAALVRYLGANLRAMEARTAANRPSSGGRYHFGQSRWPLRRVLQATYSAVDHTSAGRDRSRRPE